MTPDHPKKNIHVWVRLLSVTCMTFLCALAILGARDYATSLAKTSTIEDPSRITGINNFLVQVTIQSVDTISHTIVARVLDPATKTTVEYRFTMHEDFYVERRDAIVEDGVVVGASRKRRAQLSELNLGVRGTALTSAAPDGSILMRYLLISDPPIRF